MKTGEREDRMSNLNSVDSFTMNERNGMSNFQWHVVGRGESIWNVVDTFDEKWPSEFSSWMDFWEKVTGLEFQSYCPVCGTKFLFEGKERNANGAHVRLQNEPEDDMAWIMPLCSSCNNWQTVGEMKLQGGTALVRTKMNKKHDTAKPELKKECGK